MTSFINKKLNLILLIITTLVIITSISSVSAASATDVNVTLANGSTSPATVFVEDSVLVNITVSDSNWTSGSVTANLELWVNNTMGVDKLLLTLPNKVFRGPNTYFNNTRININDLKSLGLNQIYGKITKSPSDLTTGVYTNCTGTDNLNLTVYSPIILRLDSTSLKVGQEGNITGTAWGWNATNLKSLMRLDNVNVTMSLDGGATTDWYMTGPNGRFSFESFLFPTSYVPSLKFNVTFEAFNEYSSTPPFNITGVGANGVTYVIPNNLHEFYNDTLGINEVITASKGKIEIVDLWLDSQWGYLVGDSAHVFWELDLFGDIINQDIYAYLLLFDNSNPNNILRKVVVNLSEQSSPLTVFYPGCTGSTILDPFTQAHDDLGIRLVIEGYDFVTGKDTYQSTELEIATFVDYDANSRRTTVEAIWPASGLKVGEEGTIKFQVYDYQGNPFTGLDGLISISWDGIYSETVNVTNGIALYAHTYTLAGASRVLEYQFLGNPAFQAGTSKLYRNNTVPILKGTPTISVTQNPMNAAFVGDNVTIMANIAGLVANSAFSPVEVKFVFKSGGIAVHEVIEEIIPDQAGNIIKSSAFFDYVYVLPHNPVTITAEIIGNANYQNATSQPYAVIVTKV